MAAANMEHNENFLKTVNRVIPGLFMDLSSFNSEYLSNWAQLPHVILV